MALTTEFVKVAQSGPTIDGRKIDPNQLKQMAANYDKSVYTAVVFPGHDHNWSAYGTVESVEARDEGNAVVGLYAKIAPNAFWQSDIRYGQNVFTSIEITPNFAGTGEAYLTGLGATNNPASLGVAQLNFSVADKLYSDAYQTVFIEEPQPKPSFFSKFKREPDMKPETAQALQAQITDLTNKFAALNKLDPNPDQDKQETTDAEKYAAIEQENTALKAENDELKAAAKTRDDDFTALSTKVETFGAQLADALKEQPGTKPPQGGSDDSRAYI